MAPAAGTGVPQIVSDMFWGGLWGVLFAMIQERIPGGSLPVKGLIFGIVGPALIGVFILVPLITGRFPLFFGGDPKLIISVLLILAGFGAAMGWLYGFLTSPRDGLAQMRFGANLYSAREPASNGLGRDAPTLKFEKVGKFSFVWVLIRRAHATVFAIARSQQ
jgi:hypothetical protein